MNVAVDKRMVESLEDTSGNRYVWIIDATDAKNICCLVVLPQSREEASTIVREAQFGLQSGQPTAEVLALARETQPLGDEAIFSDRESLFEFLTGQDADSALRQHAFKVIARLPSPGEGI